MALLDGFKADLKARNLSTEARKLQVIQNSMLRMIFGFRLQDQVNMEELRDKIGMFSVNQLNCYHVLKEAFNIINLSSYLHTSTLFMRHSIDKKETQHKIFGMGFQMFYEREEKQ